MKQILFISQSQLAHNLLTTVLPLVPNKVTLDSISSIAELDSLDSKAGSYKLILIDWNLFQETDNPTPMLDMIKKHPQTQNAARILLYPHNNQRATQVFSNNDFVSFLQKPFLTDDIAKLIQTH